MLGENSYRACNHTSCGTAALNGLLFLAIGKNTLRDVVWQVVIVFVNMYWKITRHRRLKKEILMQKPPALVQLNETRSKYKNI